MIRPLIGLTMDAGDKPGRIQTYADYAISVERAGGVPVGIPFPLDGDSISALLDHLDGILFTGGDDLDPALYGEEWHPKAVRLSAARQNFELALLSEVERRRMPVLGVCLGSQVMNIHRGGSLHQFLPDVPRANAIEHRRLDREWPKHAVRLDTSSQIGRAIGKGEILANTYHKQAVNRLGRGLRVIATAPDGVIEGLEDPTFPLFVAVQWHPERLNTEEDHLAVFRLLVEKAMETSADLRRCG